LGERLFHDPQLSHDNRQSCATCHPLARGGMDGWPRAMAQNGLSHLRNTPTIFNVGLNFWFNWDGRMHTLEAHAEQLLRNPAVMNTTWPELQGKLAREATHVSAFRAAYVDGLTWNNVIAALVSFERSLTTPHSRFDTYLRGERQALTTQERAHSKPGGKSKSKGTWEGARAKQNSGLPHWFCGTAFPKR